MSTPGWYPDPGGHEGRFRYWDGSRWSAQTSTSPGGANPDGGFDPTKPLTGGTGTPPADEAGAEPGGRWRPGRPLWIVGVALALALVVVLAFGVRQGLTVLGGGSWGSSPGARDACPMSTAAPKEPPGGLTRNGRVFGGKLSYPQLPAPWSAPTLDVRVPFGRNSAHQTIQTEAYRDRWGQQMGWEASVMVSELVAGDGFYTPQQGSEFMVKCVIGEFYGQNRIDRHDTVNRATKVQGRDAWLVESHLTFDIPNLQAKGELLIVLIVATAEGEASLYYASIPDNARQWEAPARQAMADLHVEG